MKCYNCGREAGTSPPYQDTEGAVCLQCLIEPFNGPDYLRLKHHVRELERQIAQLRGDDLCPVCLGHCGYTPEKGCQAELELFDPYGSS